MVTYNDRILVPNLTKDALDTIHPETNTGNVYDFVNNEWLSDTLKNSSDKVNSHIFNSEIHVTQEKQNKWDGAQLYKLTEDNGASKNISNSDLNNTIVNGFYFGENLTNSPTGAGSGNWYIVEVSGTFPWLTQYARSYFDDILYYRRNNGGTWQPWIKILNQDDYDQLFQSVSSGKQLIANATTQKGVPTAADAEFATIASNIGLISTGVSGSHQIPALSQLQDYSFWIEDLNFEPKFAFMEVGGAVYFNGQSRAGFSANGGGLGLECYATEKQQNSGNGKWRFKFSIRQNSNSGGVSNPGTWGYYIAP